ncbi:pyrimidine-specific ribonucleoside hydrolase RihA [Nonomuraea antimicrobica]|uniref:Pyrimidine-specific ribonucleoside hydrolase RihA n=1 Tax=Nonomuraea antimicrobica TaxID=561173 RepID=A0ABP7BW08_9ACTN
MRSVLIDTDPGIDDAVAIMFARRAGLDIKALTAVSGNLQADRAAANALRVLRLLDAESIPVARGTQTPLVRPYPRDPFSHGDDGLGNTGLAASSTPLDPRFAPDVIADVVNAAPGEITVLALGPLTNLALALMRDPSLATRIAHVYLIGGAFGRNRYAYTRATGDNPVSEWNVYVDPEAAQHVFQSGVPITALGLDVVTHPDLDLRAEDRERLATSDRPEAAFLLDIADYVRDMGFDSYCGLIDSMAVAACLDPSVLTTQKLHVTVETAGTATLGQTVVDEREHFRWDHLPLLNVAVSADHNKILTMLVDALTAEPGGAS